MATFPSSPNPVYPVKERLQNRVWTSTSEGGKEQRAMRWLSAIRIFSMDYVFTDSTELATIMNFIENDAQGGAASFWYFYPVARPYANVYVGVGDGVQDIFDIPAASYSNLQVYLDGVLTGGYSILGGGGGGGVDRIDFTSAPSINELITCSFDGNIRILGVIDEAIEYSTNDYNYHSMTVVVREVRE